MVKLEIMNHEMHMKYIIQEWTLNSYTENKIEIDQPKFDELRHAQKSLSVALAIEENYELLISNYLDLEKECLNVAADYMVRTSTEYTDLFDIKLVFNRRIVNLLTSTRLYKDQITKHIEAWIPNDKNILENINLLFLVEFKACFEYRFMEALRNHVQHYGLAVCSILVERKLTSFREENREWEFKTRIFTNKLNFNNDEVFKKRNKEVLDEMPEEVELMYAARVYIESISKVHCDIRELLAHKFGESRQLVSMQIEDYKKINNGDSTGLYAVCAILKEPINEVIEKFPLLLDWDDVRIRLSKKNERLVNLRKRFVSSSVYNKPVIH